MITLTAGIAEKQVPKPLRTTVIVGAVLTITALVHTDIAAAITAHTLEIIGVAITVLTAAAAATGIYVRITSIAHSISNPSRVFEETLILYYMLFTLQL